MQCENFDGGFRDGARRREPCSAGLCVALAICGNTPHKRRRKPLRMAPVSSKVLPRDSTAGPEAPPMYVTAGGFYLHWLPWEIALDWRPQVASFHLEIRRKLMAVSATARESNGCLPRGIAGLALLESKGDKNGEDLIRSTLSVHAAR